MGFVWPRKTNPRRRIFPAANPRANQCRHPCAPRRPQISVSIRGKTSARRLSADLGLANLPLDAPLYVQQPVAIMCASGNQLSLTHAVAIDFEACELLPVIFFLAIITNHPNASLNRTRKTQKTQVCDRRKVFFAAS
jgi:hypothetical protein